MDKTCRRCKAPCESLSHILGQCRAVKWLRISRHDKIVDSVAEEASATWKVLKEPRIVRNGRTFLPDLVMVKGDKAHVVDVSVRYETDGSALARAYDEKIAKYSCLEEEIKIATGASAVTFGAIIVGSRGAWYPDNYLSFKELGIRRNLACFLSRIALRSSLAMLTRHSGGGICQRT